MKELLLQPKSAAALGLFRALFGIMLLVELFYFFDTYTEYFEGHFWHFPYHYLSFLKPPSSVVLKTLVGLGILSSFLVILGWFTRVGLLLSGGIFTYIWLLDKTFFNNHYYLISLLCLLLLFTQSDARFSLRKTKITHLPNWQYFIFYVQFLIVFFCSGLAKCNAEWFSGAVAEATIANRNLAGTSMESIVYLAMTYGGVLFDLLVGWLLFWKPTRRYAVVGLIAFNLLNIFFFNFNNDPTDTVNLGSIGYFPYLMLATSVLYLDIPYWLNKFRTKPQLPQKKKAKKQQQTTATVLAPTARFVLPILAVYFAVQILLPFRHLTQPGYVDWNGKGYYFSWRMKNFVKNGEFQFYGFDRATGESVYDYNFNNMEVAFAQKAALFPSLVWQMAHCIKQYHMEQGTDLPLIRVDYKTTFNKHEKQYGIDPSVNLSEVGYHPWRKDDWIQPLK